MGRPFFRWAFALSLLLGACDGDEATLVVDVLTNYRPGVDFDGVVVAVHRGDDLRAEAEPIRTAPLRAVSAIAGSPAPFRAGDVEGLGAGTWLVVARLRRGLVEVANGRALVVTDGTSRSITVFVTSECDGVVCPGASDPSLTACFGGRCVDPRCGPDAPDLCMTTVCGTDAECPAAGGPSCVRPACLGGACASFPDDALCADGALCDPVDGCTGGPPDAGAADAGADDAGTDAGPAPLPPFVEIAAGADHTCARTAARELYCWGANASGQLGRAGAGSASPSLVLTDADEVALGDDHSCARRGGQVLCWGSNEFGQLGAGLPSMSATPLTVPIIDDAVQIAIGDEHSCARRAGGTVRCWGRGDAGQLGNGSTLLRQPSPNTLDAPATVTHVAAGQLHTCVIVSDGSLHCTGLNFSGQLGDGTTDNAPSPVATLLPSSVTDAGLGFGHTCAALSDGSMRCFGDNSHGQLGDGSTTDSPTPVTVTGVSGLDELVIGGFHGCIRNGAALSCWGDNEHGQLGDGSMTDRPSPVLVGGGVAFVTVAAGGAHTCGLDASGAAYCWGRNDQGQLGSPGGSRLTPTRVVP